MLPPVPPLLSSLPHTLQGLPVFSLWQWAGPCWRSVLFYNIVGKERERQSERVGKRQREGDCQKHYTISKRPVHSPQSFDSGQGGVRVRKTQGEGPGELFKEGSVIYRDPHIGKKVGWMQLWGGECFSAGCPAVKKGKKKNLSRAPSPCPSVSLSPPLAFPLIFNKQQLRLSATGRQFVPTTKNHGNDHWKSPSGSKGPPSRPSPTPSALWALCKFGRNMKDRTQ